MTLRSVDTIVVGGGPAGSSAARELVRAGRSCLVLDRKPMPRLKLCGGWITQKVLADLDFQPADYPHGIIPLARIRFYVGRRRRWSCEVPTGQYSIRRIEFDAWLMERSGAELVEHTVRSIERDNGDFVIDGSFRTRHLIGAGGTNCPVKKAFFAPDQGELIVAQEVEFETTPRHPVCTLWFPYAGAFGYAWYVPKAGAVNVGFGGLRKHNESWDKQQLWRDFVRLLHDTGCIDQEPPPPKGYSYYIGHRRKTVRCERAYIVGDAAGLATMDLAEGIGPAIESGQLAARDILGQATYSTKSITRHSLPWSFRLLRNAVGWIP
jgi:flavin-dependent dehydrogenase